MKVSDLIQELQEFYQTHGDLQVMSYAAVSVEFSEAGRHNPATIESELGTGVTVEVDLYPLPPKGVQPVAKADVARAKICVVSA